MSRLQFRLISVVLSALSILNFGSCSSSTEPPAPTRLAFRTGPSGTAAGSSLSPIEVAIEDKNGATVSSAMTTVTIALQSSVPGAALSGSASAVTVDGVATFTNLSVAKAGSGYSLTASAPNLAPATSGTFSILAGGAAKLAISAQPATSVAGSAVTPAVVVNVLDGLDNIVTDATNNISISLAANPDGGTLHGTTTVNAVNGVAIFSNLRINKEGAGYTLLAGGANLTSATSSTFSIVSAPASNLQFLAQPSDAVAGTPMSPPIQVAVTDSVGNVIKAFTGGPVTLVLTHPNFSLTGTTTRSPVNGVATFDDIELDKWGSGWTIRADDPGLASAVSSGFSIATGAPTNLSGGFEGAMNLKAGQIFTPDLDVEVHDDYGNRVLTATDAITIAIVDNPAGGVLSGTTTRNAINGLAIFTDLSIDKPGQYSLGITAPGLAGFIYVGINVNP